jgi:hypothetical protein
MAGGLLNIVSVGNNNVMLTGNPTKTFFKVTYNKYTNFGLQKFRIDYDGLRELRLNESSTFSFKIPRYAELLMDSYIVVSLPDIYSPVYHPVTGNDSKWSPYEFRWIENIGAMMIESVEITAGNMTLQKYSGNYINALVERDFTEDKKKLFKEMSGDIEELNTPSQSNNRINTYPNAIYTTNSNGAEPSIRGRNLYVPLCAWFSMNNGCALPLIALQYNEVKINVTLRPIRDLFQVRDIFDPANNYPYVKPDFNEDRYHMYRFLQTPPSFQLDAANYTNKVSTWNADVHLMTTYCFLSKEEATKFAKQDHVYLVKDIHEYKHENITGAKKIKLETSGMVASWMFYLQRNDINLRNEWSNFSNWPYRTLPQNTDLYYAYEKDANGNLTGQEDIAGNFPNVNPDVAVANSSETRGRIRTGLSHTGNYAVVNRKHILETLGIVFDGDYRENLLTHGVYDYIEKFSHSKGNAKPGLYCYNFCLNTSPFEYQPSGAINMSRFKTIELELTTYTPPVDDVNSSFDIICDTDGNPIGVRKANWRLFDYNYNLHLMEERYNIISFINGTCGLMYAR